MLFLLFFFIGIIIILGILVCDSIVSISYEDFAILDLFLDFGDCILQLIADEVDEWFCGHNGLWLNLTEFGNMFGKLLNERWNEISWAVKALMSVGQCRDVFIRMGFDCFQHNPLWLFAEPSWRWCDFLPFTWHEFLI